jgi:hypothetical protein
MNKTALILLLIPAINMYAMENDHSDTENQKKKSSELVLHEIRIEPNASMSEGMEHYQDRDGSSKFRTSSLHSNYSEEKNSIERSTFIELDHENKLQELKMTVVNNKVTAGIITNGQRLAELSALSYQKALLESTVETLNRMAAEQHRNQTTTLKKAMFDLGFSTQESIEKKLNSNIKNLLHEMRSRDIAIAILLAAFTGSNIILLAYK